MGDEQQAKSSIHINIVSAYPIFQKVCEVAEARGAAHHPRARNTKGLESKGACLCLCCLPDAYSS